MGLSQEFFEKNGIIINNGHFVYTTEGLHGKHYFDKDKILSDINLMETVSYHISCPFKNDSIDVVVGPAVAGAILANRVALCLTDWGRNIKSVYADKQKDGFILKRGYGKLIEGKRILIVEDVLNSGASAKKIVDLVSAFGGNIVGVSTIFSYKKANAESLGVSRLEVLLSLYQETFEPQDCPMCKSGIPLNTELGHGKSINRI